MNSKPDDHQSRTSDTDYRERLTTVYAAFNHAMANQGGDLMALTRDASWTEAVDGEVTEWTTQVGTAVAEHVSTLIPETTDHLQALPERFAEESGTIIVTGAYVGTTAGGSRFNVPFTHTYELENGVLFEQPIDTGDTHENR